MYRTPYYDVDVTNNFHFKLNKQEINHKMLKVVTSKAPSMVYNNFINLNKFECWILMIT